jgi:zinc transport system substrate-binding protein
MNASSKKGLLPVIALVAAVVAIAAFVALSPGRKTGTTPTESADKVAVTVFPAYDIVRNVAGDAVQVALLLPPGSEPHTFEPTPSTVRELEGAEAIYMIGHGMDDWAATLAESSGADKVTLDAGISLRPIMEDFGTRSSSGQEGTVDPHYWLAVSNAKKMAKTAAQDMITRFPSAEAAINANLASYLTKLDALDANIRQILSGPFMSDLITFHGAWYYFAQEYGLSVRGTFEPAGGKEPTPKYLAQLGDVVEKLNVETLYVEPLFDDALAESFAEEHGLKLAAIDPIGGATGRDTYEQLMLYNAQTIRAGK